MCSLVFFLNLPPNLINIVLARFLNRIKVVLRTANSRRTVQVEMVMNATGSANEFDRKAQLN